MRCTMPCAQQANGEFSSCWTIACAACQSPSSRRATARGRSGALLPEGNGLLRLGPLEARQEPALEVGVLRKIVLHHREREGDARHHEIGHVPALRAEVAVLREVVVEDLELGPQFGV